MSDGNRALGRPRDGDAGPALLDAARRLVLERGYDEVSVGMIASEAGVGRQTLYRRWPSKAELVLDAFFQSASRMDIVSEGTTQEALQGFLESLFQNLSADGPAIRHLIASAQSDLQFLSVFKERFVRPRAAVAMEILKRGVTSFELSTNADLDVAIDALHGSFWYRLLQDEPLDNLFAERLSRFILAACA